MFCTHINARILYFASYLGKKNNEICFVQAFTADSDVVATYISPCELAV